MASSGMTTEWSGARFNEWRKVQNQNKCRCYLFLSVSARCRMYNITTVSSKPAQFVFHMCSYQLKPPPYFTTVTPLVVRKESFFLTT